MTRNNVVTLAKIESDDQRFHEFFVNREKIYAYVVENLLSGPDSFYILSEEVAEWCWNNTGPYRLFHEWGNNPQTLWGTLSVKIEFKYSQDAVFFSLKWI